MKAIVAAIHGILTSQTEASWPDKFDAWMFRRERTVKVLKKEYRAGPFPLWNCLVKDPWLARGLASELELFLRPKRGRKSLCPPVWFVAHSNGAVIALITAKRLMARGYCVGGLILTGAACEAELGRNGIRSWLDSGRLGRAIAYSSAEDAVLGGEARGAQSGARPAWWRRLREWFWGKCLWPYGSLGRTGWLLEGREWKASAAYRGRLFTRWFRGGHTGYFAPRKLHRTFALIYRDILHPHL